MTRAVVIINPLSGHGRHQHQIDAHAALAREVFARHDLDVEVQATAAPGDARTLAGAAAASGCRLVVVWGGDGTVNEAAGALMHTEATLAIVPAGSGNGLALDLGVPFDAAAALALAASGPALTIDAGQVDDCFFFNIAGVGIDAVVAARFAERGLRQRGLLGYAQISTQELLRYRAQTYSLVIDGETSEHSAMLVAVANGRQYGNRLLIAPGAKLDDGLLEVVIVEQLSMLGIAWRLPSLFRGTLTSGRGVTMRAARRLQIRAPGSIPFHVDGEPRLGRDELLIQTHPAALRVRTTRA